MLREWLLLPLVGALIGYITNVIAIRMLFRPRRPLRVPGTTWVIQGVVPMRQSDLAKAIGETVERDLLPIDTLVDKLDIAGYKEQIVATIVDHAGRRVRESLPHFIPSPLQDSIIGFVRDLATRETGAMLDSVTIKLRDQMRNDVHVGEMVEQKIKELDLTALEQLILNVSHQELRHIEVLGAVLGWLIGAGQVLLLMLLR